MGNQQGTKEKQMGGVRGHKKCWVSWYEDLAQV